MKALIFLCLILASCSSPSEPAEPVAVYVYLVPAFCSWPIGQIGDTFTGESFTVDDDSLYQTKDDGNVIAWPIELRRDNANVWFSTTDKVRRFQGVIGKNLTGTPGKRTAYIGRYREPSKLGHA